MKSKFKVSFLDLYEVKKWFSKANLDSCYYSENPLQNCVLTLLYVCAEAELNPISIVYLDHGLEALLQTKPGESFSSLKRRIKQIIDFDRRDEKMIDKKLKEFYDLRSGFMHGSMAIMHPVANEILHKNYMDYTNKLMESSDFIAVIYIALLQKII